MSVQVGWLVVCVCVVVVVVGANAGCRGFLCDGLWYEQAGSGCFPSADARDLHMRRVRRLFLCNTGSRAGWSSAGSVSREFIACGHVIVVGSPLLGLEVRIEEVRGVEVGAGKR